MKTNKLIQTIRRRNKRGNKKKLIVEGYCSTCTIQMAAPGYMTCNDCLRRKRIERTFRNLYSDSEWELSYLLQQGE